MKLSKKYTPVVGLLALGLMLSAPMPASAQAVDDPVAACLKAWGEHPFGKNPKFKTLGTSATVFGIGKSAGDTERTATPSLVLVNPIFNLMGRSTIELLNPNGWYCMRTAVSVIGEVRIRADCKARLAETSDGVALRGDSINYRKMKDLNVTVMGDVAIERPCG